MGKNTQNISFGNKNTLKYIEEISNPNENFFNELINNILEQFGGR